MMTLRMTFKKWDFPGVFKEDFKGDFEGYFKGSLGGTWRGTWKGQQTWMGRWRGTSKEILEGTSNRTWKGTFCQAKVRSRSGLVQVWFRLQLQDFSDLPYKSSVIAFDFVRFRAELGLDQGHQTWIGLGLLKCNIKGLLKLWSKNYCLLLLKLKCQ